ncbi:uncharacterized protein LOC110254377 [Exaiptasia diaphana]|uniref:Class II aldolase/adducin N-terminal domain-containing protein n=1 Tax=Exaiptasia diaphana TaxID=2652724 RepID=A0A913YB52_EXADI|nr:uncharacterized protein LOC110254377 [Exaiptasia diaphana]KXJ06413.1 putative aldolase class 2 protein CC-1201 [Exaiptasia diaphana]
MFAFKNLTKLGVTSAYAFCRRADIAVSTQLVSTLQHNTKPFSTLKTDRRSKLGLEEARMANWEGRVDLAAAFRGLEMMDFHEGICNHLSLIVPAENGDGEVMLMNSHGNHWKEIEPESLVGINEQGDTVEGTGDVEISAKTIHLGIHQARPDAKCAFHVHPPYTTAMGMLQDLPFGMYHQNSLMFYNDFAYDREYGGFSQDITEGQRIATHIKDKSVLFMCNHGVMVVGQNVADVFYLVYYLERACMFQALAMSTGRELTKIPDDLSRETKIIANKERHLYSGPFLESIKRVTGVKTSKTLQ